MDEDIKAAKKVLEDISQDEYEQQKAYLRNKYIMDWKSFISDGFARGKAEGIKEGIDEEKIEIAKKLLEQNIEIEVIIKATGLTKEEIKDIKDDIKNDSNKK